MQNKELGEPVDLKEYDAQQKAVIELAKKKMKPVIKSVNGKALILKGVIEKISPLKSKFGGSARIEMGGVSYYFNYSGDEKIVHKMFLVGQPSAFTVAESPNKRNPEKPFLVIQQVFFTF